MFKWDKNRRLKYFLEQIPTPRSSIIKAVLPYSVVMHGYVEPEC